MHLLLAEVDGGLTFVTMCMVQGYISVEARNLPAVSIGHQLKTTDTASKPWNTNYFSENRMRDTDVILLGTSLK